MSTLILASVSALSPMLLKSDMFKVKVKTSFFLSFAPETFRESLNIYSSKENNYSEFTTLVNFLVKCEIFKIQLPQ